jgi:hypothetical protein
MMTLVFENEHRSVQRLPVPGGDLYIVSNKNTGHIASSFVPCTVVKKGSQSDKILGCLPGTAVQVSLKTGLGLTRCRELLSKLKAKGIVIKEGDSYVQA